MSERGKTITDDVIGRAFDEISVRECKYPAVVKRYGHGGICHVSVYTCIKCKFALRVPFTSALKCGYESEERDEHDI